MRGSNRDAFDLVEGEIVIAPVVELGRLRRFVVSHLLALPREVRHWSLTTLREKLIKIGAKVVSRSKAVTFQMAEVAVPRTLFAEILERIDRLRLVPATG